MSVEAPVANISPLRGLLTKKVTRKVGFMGVKVDMNKLTLLEVKGIQENAAKAGGESATDEAGLKTLIFVIKQACPDFNEFTDEEFENYPLDELTTLSNEIMKYSGLDAKAGN